MSNRPKIPVYVVIARALQALENTRKSNNREWMERHETRIEKLIKDHLPTGSGIDNGTKLLPESTDEKMVLQAAYHHMTDHGYAGWTDHRITLTPSLTSGFKLRISGSNRADIKDYLHEVYDIALRELIDEYPDTRESTEAVAGPASAPEVKVPSERRDGFVKREFTDHTLAQFLNEHGAIDNAQAVGRDSSQANMWRTPDKRVLVVAHYSGPGGMNVTYWVRDPI